MVRFFLSNNFGTKTIEASRRCRAPKASCTKISPKLASCCAKSLSHSFSPEKKRRFSRRIIWFFALSPRCFASIIVGAKLTRYPCFLNQGSNCFVESSGWLFVGRPKWVAKKMVPFFFKIKSMVGLIALRRWVCLMMPLVIGTLRSARNKIFFFSRSIVGNCEAMVYTVILQSAK